MVDIGSSINIIPLSVLEPIGVYGDRIVKQPIRASGFGGTFLFTLSHINLEQIVGPMNKFYVIGGGYLSYYVLLGSLIHRHKPSYPPTIDSQRFFGGE